LLGTNKGNIFCFSTTVDQSQWKDLNEGQKYWFTVRKSASGVRILTDFDLVETPK
jgi:cold shock CspA family protein